MQLHDFIKEFLFHYINYNFKKKNIYTSLNLYY